MKSLFTGKMPTAFTLATCIGAVTAQPAAAAAVTPPGALQSCQAHLGWVPLEEAHEIVNIATMQTNPELPIPTYKSGGSNIIPDDLWPAYAPAPPYLKNTTRNLQFNESQFISSPGQPCGSTAYVTTPDGYTWAAMSMAINAMWPYDPAQYSGQAALNAYYAGNLVTTPPPGVVKVTANYKAQNMKFWANENGVPPGQAGAVPLDRYFVTDQWGNEYIMHASGQIDQSQVAASFAAAILPPGWAKSVRQLKQDLILNPAQGADGSFHYLIFRDSTDNTYHQVGWSPLGSLQAQVECGPGAAGHLCDMPIWGGEATDALSGDQGGVRNDAMHGAGGHDVLFPGYGDDEIWGDAGTDTVVLPGKRSDYAVAYLSADYTKLVLSGAAGTKTMVYCEFLQFDDVRLPVKSFHGRR